MLALIGRRTLIALPTLFLVSLFVFALQRALPGDPFLVIAGEERDPEVIARLRALYRLDDPIVVQFFAWLGQVVQGDFGRSLRTGEPVLGLILQKLPVTLQLAIASIMGVLFCFLAFVLIVVTIIRKLVFGDPTSGWPSLVCIISLVSGVQLFCLGIVGQYLAKTYLEVKKRPIYLVKEKI